MKSYAGNKRTTKLNTSLHRTYVYVVVLMIANLFFIHNLFAQSQTFSTPGTFSGVNGFTAPAGVTKITVEVWGAGGAGGGGNTVASGGGGGGGYKKVIDVTVVPGTQYTIVVGAGGSGAATNGQAGGLSSGTFWSHYCFSNRWRWRRWRS